MRKLTRIFLFIIAVSVVAATIWALRGFAAGASPVFLTTSSPKRTYTVQFAGRQGRPFLPAAVNTVRFSVRKDADVVLSDRYLHSGDWLDPSFAILYPQHDWPSENVLHLYRQEYFTRGAASKVVVRNDSAVAIKYLRVTSDDTHLLFDVEPGSQMELRIPPARGDLRYITVEGEFSDSKPVEEVGENFFIDKQPTTFYINVAGNLPTIESPGKQKYPR